MNSVSLDTNAYSAYLLGNKKVLNALIKADIVYMSTIMIGELYAGFYGGSKFEKNKEYLESFLKKSTVTILEVTLTTAETFGRIKNNLKEIGSPLPLNDIWIAAHAIETNSELITFDTHFKKIPGLKIWNYKGFQ